MAQVTIYLEDTLADAMRTTAKANNISQSRWISHLIEQALQTEWPADVAALAGSWRDFPSLDDIRQTIGTDSTRETL